MVGGATALQNDAATTASAAVRFTHATDRVRTTAPHVAFHALHAPALHAYDGQAARTTISLVAGLVSEAHSDALTTASLEALSTQVSVREWVAGPHVAFHAPQALVRQA